jgi:hypothetical protein
MAATKKRERRDVRRSRSVLDPKIRACLPRDAAPAEDHVAAE